MLIDITIKTSKHKCSYKAGDMLIYGTIVIRDQSTGNLIQEVMAETKSYGPGFSSTTIHEKLKVNLFKSFNFVKNFMSSHDEIGNFEMLEVIAAYAFKDKGETEEFELTFRNIPYDPQKKPLCAERTVFGGHELLLNATEIGVNKKPFDVWSAVNVGADQLAVKNRLADFIELLKKLSSLNKNLSSSIEQIILLFSTFEEYKQPKNREIYELKTFSQDSQNGDKGKIYHQHESIFTEILSEISQEKQR
ncbi:10958_t:CDS:1 [Ambispora leptoticha]|uniref:10958_t:CDS:1 n=1 Tax=Ambispora leptoticha TaxID=144679 RepID=A0A9N8VKK3_9GLOM|nr:10958_t:CDS:1 [Ambispora leptoticha]